MKWKNCKKQKPKKIYELIDNRRKRRKVYIVKNKVDVVMVAHLKEKRGSYPIGPKFYFISAWNGQPIVNIKEWMPLPK